MRNLILCTLTLLVLSCSFAYAGAGHSHGPVTPVTEQQAIDKATNIVKILAKKGSVDTSWQEITAGSSSKKMTKGGQEWLITFNNPQIADQTKQTLYVFLNLGGEYIAANYTGK